MVVKISSIPRMLADICFQVEENSHLDRQTLKEDLRIKKSEIKDGYASSASTQGSQGTLWKSLGVVNIACAVGAAAIPALLGAIGQGAAAIPAIQRTAQLIPEIGSQLTKGYESSLSGKITLYQGTSQIGIKELDVNQTKLQEIGTLGQKVQSLFQEAISSENRSIGG